MFKRLLVMGMLLAGGRAQAGFQHAYGEPTCAPWDGAAFSVVIQDAPIAAHKPGSLPKAAFPHYQVNVWTSKPEIGRWIKLPQPGDRAGTIISCPSAGKCEVRAGRLRLDVFNADRVKGELRVELGDKTGRELVFPFDGPYFHSPMFCG
jgi:hypothetical protein